MRRERDRGRRHRRRHGTSTPADRDRAPRVPAGVDRRDVWALAFGATVARVGAVLRQHRSRRRPSRQQLARDDRAATRASPSCSDRCRRSTPSAATRSTSASSSSRRSARSGRCSPRPGCSAARRTPAAGSSCWPAAPRPRRATAATLGALGGGGRDHLRRHDADHAARRPRPRGRVRRRRDRALRAEPRDRAGGVRRRRRGHVAARPHAAGRDRARAWRVFGVAFVVRMIADSGPGTRWLLWVTPFGWIERMRPFTAQRPVAARCPRRVTVVVLVGRRRRRWPAPRRRRRRARVARRRAAAAVRTAARRSGLAARSSCPCSSRGARAPRPPRSRSGSSPRSTTGIGARLARTTRSTSSACRAPSSNQYFGVAFLLVATVVALLPARPDRGRGRRGDVGPPRARARPAGPSRTALFGGTARARRAAAIVVAGPARRVSARGSARGRRASTSALGRWSAPASTSCPTALVALGIGARRRSRSRRGARRPTVYAVVDLVAASSTCSARWSTGSTWLEHLVAVPLHGARAGAGSRRDDHRHHARARRSRCASCATLLFERRDVQSE